MILHSLAPMLAPVPVLVLVLDSKNPHPKAEVRYSNSVPQRKQVMAHYRPKEQECHQLVWDSDSNWK